MSRFTVDIDQLTAASGNVRATMARIQQDGQGMHTQLQGLSQTWQGGAASAFQSVAEHWVVTQRRVEESMHELNRALGMAGQHYLDTEMSNQRMFAG